VSRNRSVPRPSRRAAVALLLPAVALVALAVPAGAGAKKVTVETRNLYLGADLAPALGAATVADLYEEAGTIYRDVQETNFPARAKLLAEEIKQSGPDFVGLQEVALWRRDANGAPDGPATPATEVVYDFLDSLRHELDRAGLHYRVASKQTEADFELPVDFVDDDVAAPSYDVRLTMRDVILVKRGVDTSNPRSENYTTELPVPTVAGTINVKRGWASIDASIGGKDIRVVDTHLEAFSADIRNSQAQELIFPGGPLDTGRKTILVGDLNSDPDDAAPEGTAYDTVTGAGFKDRGVTVDTCCHDADLLDAGGQFDQRIDHVLTKPGLDLVRSTLLGDDPAMRTPFGLWPSDHGGVVSTLQLG
jgi:endonuclease/exonuclease/phosphatase family metal-dependent hydrolase